VLPVDPDIECIGVGMGGLVLTAGVGRDVVFWDLRSTRVVRCTCARCLFARGSAGLCVPCITCVRVCAVWCVQCVKCVGVGVDGTRAAGFQLGEYTDSHADSVTHIMFHPTAPTQILSASEDGLLCVFDMRAKVEDDALVTVIPTEGGCPLAVGTFGPKAAFAYCATDMGNVSLWNLATAEPVVEVKPPQLQELAKCHNVREAWVLLLSLSLSLVCMLMVRRSHHGTDPIQRCC